MEGRAADQGDEAVDQQAGKADGERGQQPLDEEQGHPAEREPGRGMVDQPEGAREVGEMLEEVAEAGHQCDFWIAAARALATWQK